MSAPYKKTMTACFLGYIIQAIVNNYVPLLFVTFQNYYGIPLSKITLLITINFIVQLSVDLLSAGFVDKIGYRASIVSAHAFAAAGLVLLTVLPEIFADPFVGILISVIIYAVGGGLLEVLVSPMVEACPTENKEKTMSFLHSFYCFGQVGVVLLATLFFGVFGINNWKILAICLALFPISNGLLFCKVPIYSLDSQEEKGLSLKELFSKKIFWIMMIMMTCAGAAELTVSQWSSAFAESGLGVSKAVGDLAGPMSFALFMGASRLIYGKSGSKLDLDAFIRWSAILCIISYLCIALVPSPVIGLLGCALCGFSVGIFWPGSYSKATASIKGGGTAMFALLAFAGDVGCTAGPTLAGFVSTAFGNNLHIGILSAVVFPVILLLCIGFKKKTKKD